MKYQDIIKLRAALKHKISYASNHLESLKKQREHCFARLTMMSIKLNTQAVYIKELKKTDQSYSVQQAVLKRKQTREFLKTLPKIDPLNPKLPEGFGI